MHDGTATAHEGNYSSYTARLRAAADEAEQQAAKEREANRVARQREERKAREANKGTQTARKPLGAAPSLPALEERAAYLEGQLMKLRELLGTPETYENTARANALENEYHKLSAELEVVYEQWETAELAREAAQSPGDTSL
jgi:hypothetical protein